MTRWNINYQLGNKYLNYRTKVSHSSIDKDWPFEKPNTTGGFELAWFWVCVAPPPPPNNNGSLVFVKKLPPEGERGKEFIKELSWKEVEEGSKEESRNEAEAREDESGRDARIAASSILGEFENWKLDRRVGRTRDGVRWKEKWMG